MSLRCHSEDFQSFGVNDDGITTHTSREQNDVELVVNACYKNFRILYEGDTSLPKLHRDRHIAFLKKGIEHLSESYECLDASRPWICYWILHSMELLNVPIPEETANKISGFLGKCQSPTGGFGGGPGQDAHLAPTYAAVNALCILGTKEAYDIINRKTLQDFILRMHQPDGSFFMHDGGEVDIRATYCAASAARLTNLVIPEMFDSTPQWIVSCQTYEGGFAGAPDMEAHGGYSFCGLAALVLLGKERLCDLQAMLRWVSRRQMSLEGGFQGRTNKLVDGCYSFWQGGAFPLIHMILSKEGDEALKANTWMFHQGALQEYILMCCQHHGGGLIDKPGKPRDYYHTCYCLSGLSTAQNTAGSPMIIGNPKNHLAAVHPVYNIGIDAVQNATQYFRDLPKYPMKDL